MLVLCLGRKYVISLPVHMCESMHAQSAERKGHRHGKGVAYVMSLAKQSAGDICDRLMAVHLGLMIFFTYR